MKPILILPPAALVDMAESLSAHELRDAVTPAILLAMAALMNARRFTWIPFCLPVWSSTFVAIALSSRTGHCQLSIVHYPFFSRDVLTQSLYLRFNWRFAMGNGQ